MTTINKEMPKVEMPKVFVSPTSFASTQLSFAKERLENSGLSVSYNLTGKPLEANELIKAASCCVGILAGLDDFSASVLEQLPQLRVISRYGVGVDRVDLAAAAKAGIVVTNTPGANAIAVAELALTCMFSLARQVHTLNEVTRGGKWPRVVGTELSGATLGIVGYGCIGRALRSLVEGLHMEVLVYDPLFEPSSDPSVRPVSLEELVKSSDFISLHLPLIESTRNLFDDDLFAIMSEGTFLVNTSRGGIIDQKAAASALRSGTLAGLALDAYQVEPPDPADELFTFPNVLATPHVGAQTFGSRKRMATAAIDNLLAVLHGEKVKNLAIPDLANNTIKGNQD